MEDSVTYQAILRKGKIAGQQEMLLSQGEHRFGPAGETVRAKIASIREDFQLIAIGKRLLRVASWEELLANS